MACAISRQIFECEPQDILHFKGPYSKIVTEYLIIRNLTDSPIIYKVKATYPNYFSVEPNNGTIKAKCFTKIAITFLFPDYLLNKEKVLELNSFIKFKVQITNAPDFQIERNKFFQNLNASDIKEHILSCTFDLPDETIYNLQYLTRNFSAFNNLDKIGDYLGKVKQELLKIGEKFDSLKEDTLTKKNE